METQTTNVTPVKPKSKTKKFIRWTILILLLILSLVVYFRYFFVYSEGTRVGILYKFSKKGTVFKTYEGEIMLPGYSRAGATASTKTFFFSVTNENVANQLMKNQGGELEVHYVYYNRPLMWRGDSYEGDKGQYIIDKIVKIKDKNPQGYGM